MLEVLRASGAAIEIAGAKTVLIVAIAAAMVALALVMARFGALYVRATHAGVNVGLHDLLGMWFRKVDPRVIVDNLIVAKKADLRISSDMLEAHYLVGGNVERVVLALVEAKRAGIALDFAKAVAVDLSGRDVLEEVRTHPQP